MTCKVKPTLLTLPCITNVFTAQKKTKTLYKTQQIETRWADGQRMGSSEDVWSGGGGGQRRQLGGVVECLWPVKYCSHRSWNHLIVVRRWQLLLRMPTHALTSIPLVQSVLVQFSPPLSSLPACYCWTGSVLPAATQNLSLVSLHCQMQDALKVLGIKTSKFFLVSEMLWHFKGVC